jgi:signal transduction histidine kinase
MLAHDVRGALQSILLNAEVIGVEGPSAPAQAVLARTQRSARWIDELVAKVLEAARTESGRIVLDRRPVSITAIARAAIELHESSAAAARGRIELVDHTGELTVMADRVRLERVVGNLLENAIRHSPAGITITVEAMATPSHVRIAVRDQGPGIPAELRPRLFERFVQGTTKSGSVGLGLYIARQLVELHGGHIVIEDVVPHGTTMIVELPRGAC